MENNKKFIEETIKNNREIMKSQKHLMADIKTDQQLQLPQPPIERPHDSSGEVIKLPEVNTEVLAERDIYECMKDRRSLRVYKDDNLSLEEFSYLLWATQGVERIAANNTATFRAVPSSGARHPYETYLAVNRVEGLKQGIYRFLPTTHELIFLHALDNFEESMTEAGMGQKFVGHSAVTFIWSNVPYRGEWRYSITSHKSMLIDVGHICQNLYLACESIGCGTCGIASYVQKLMDKIIGVDGEDEYTVYIAPVGRR